jgi:hypothetical protein
MKFFITGQEKITFKDRWLIKRGDHMGRSILCSYLDGIWAHTIDTLQHQSLSLMSSALDHSTTSAILKLYNILYFLWLYNEFFINLYNILNIVELDCCQIIILSIFVPSIHA